MGHQHDHSGCCSHEHGHEHGCCHHDQECCDQEQSCHGHGQEDFAHDLLEMADEAWMCLLKDKIKAEISKVSGAHLDELAKLVASSNKERWDHKMAKHRVIDSYREKLAEFFNRSK